MVSVSKHKWRIALKDWPNTQEKRKRKAQMSAFTALLRAHESLMMDHVAIEAERSGLKMTIPMYDGALFLMPKTYS